MAIVVGVSHGMLNVVSTTAAYRLLADVPAGLERATAWADEYEAAHPSIFAAYYSGFGDPAGRREACAGVDVVLASSPSPSGIMSHRANPKR